MSQFHAGFLSCFHMEHLNTSQHPNNGACGRLNGSLSFHFVIILLKLLYI
jgi:hypothetical protein